VRACGRVIDGAAVGAAGLRGFAVRRQAGAAGGTLAAMLPVLDGHGTWREIGSDTTELLLTALGVDREEARTLARSELPPLATTT